MSPKKELLFIRLLKPLPSQLDSRHQYNEKKFAFFRGEFEKDGRQIVYWSYKFYMPDAWHMAVEIRRREMDAMLQYIEREEEFHHYENGRFLVVSWPRQEDCYMLLSLTEHNRTWGMVLTREDVATLKNLCFIASYIIANQGIDEDRLRKILLWIFGKIVLWDMANYKNIDNLDGQSVVGDEDFQRAITFVGRDRIATSITEEFEHYLKKALKPRIDFREKVLLSEDLKTVTSLIQDGKIENNPEVRFALLYWDTYLQSQEYEKFTCDGRVPSFDWVEN